MTFIDNNDLNIMFVMNVSDEIMSRSVSKMVLYINELNTLKLFVQ